MEVGTRKRAGLGLMFVLASSPFAVKDAFMAMITYGDDHHREPHQQRQILRQRGPPLLSGGGCEFGSLRACWWMTRLASCSSLCCVVHVAEGKTTSFADLRLTAKGKNKPGRPAIVNEARFDVCCTAMPNRWAFARSHNTTCPALRSR